ncbi:MAG: dockerin type I repeat-containing protein, partial [Clostridia bacterium]|nr:dockerin type I repeat-containing protein [Clostridia bacterium]
FGNYSYSLYRNVVQDGVKGVHLYAFGLNNPIFIPMEEGGAMKGDMDGDGEITVADALKALRIAAKLVQPTEEDIALGDVDNDGEITVADALKILRVAAKLADASSLG